MKIYISGRAIMKIYLLCNIEKDCNCLTFISNESLKITTRHLSKLDGNKLVLLNLFTARISLYSKYKAIKTCVWKGV